jgi:ketosteroid isomerase-like protein
LGTIIFLVLLGSVGLNAGGGSILAQETEVVGENQAADTVTVYKTATCGCCGKWVDHLQQSGLDVDVIVVDETSSIRSSLGVPSHLASCHTAKVGDYWVEGHVPADLVQRLLDEKPANIKGIAVPGMPSGSPGMESPNPVTYQVLSVDGDGEVGVYATRDGQVMVDGKTESEKATLVTESSHAHSDSSAHVKPGHVENDDHPASQIAVQLSEAIAAGDVTALRELLAADVLIFESGGVESSLAEYEGHHMPADMAFMKAMNREVLFRQVFVAGDSATVVTRSRIHGEYKEKDVDLFSTETLVLTNLNGQWKVVHIHWSSS